MGQDTPVLFKELRCDQWTIEKANIFLFYFHGQYIHEEQLWY